MDYSLGILPLYEVAKVFNRIGTKPYIFGAMARFGGFVYSYSRSEQRAVPAEFVTYLRQEQRRRLIAMFTSK